MWCEIRPGNFFECIDNQKEEKIKALHVAISHIFWIISKNDYFLKDNMTTSKSTKCFAQFDIFVIRLMGFRDDFFSSSDVWFVGQLSFFHIANYCIFRETLFDL